MVKVTHNYFFNQNFRDPAILDENEGSEGTEGANGAEGPNHITKLVTVALIKVR